MNKIGTLLKTSVALFVTLGNLSAQDSVVVGWHDFSQGYQHYRYANSAKSAVSDLTGISGSLYGGNGSRNTWGSTDGTYGPTQTVGNTAADGAMSIRIQGDTIYFSVENNSDYNLVLNTITFDFSSVNGGSPENLQVYYDSGDLNFSDDTLLTALTSIHNGLALVDDYEDESVSLASLADQTLAPGESALFRFQVDTATNAWQALLLDNVAILGFAEHYLLTGWHDFSEGYQDYITAGSPKTATSDFGDVTGELYGGNGSRNTWGSSDGTYGPVAVVGSTATDGAMSIRTQADTVHFSITNNFPDKNLLLSTIEFDFASVSVNAPQNMQVYYDHGDLDDSDGTLLVAMTSIHNGLGAIGDYEDETVPLTPLSDQTLTLGETAHFRFEVDTASNGYQALALDNIAIMGVPTSADFRIVTYNMHGGEGPNGEGDITSNLTSFRDNYLQGEDVLCLQEVGSGSSVSDEWAVVTAVFSDYPYTYLTENETTGFIWPWESQQKTACAILSKRPFLSTHNELIQTDPQGDEWERHAQHAQIQWGSKQIDIFNFHNTYNFFDNDYESEKSGLTKFRDYVYSQLSITSLDDADQLVMAGDFNVLQADVIEILPTPARRSNGLDHISSIPLHSTAGAYATAGASLSDHNAVWAEIQTSSD